MKKFLTSYDYKRFNKSRALSRFDRNQKSKIKRKNKNRFITSVETYHALKEKKKFPPNRPYFSIKPYAYAPQNLSLITNTTECLEFLRDIRSDAYTSRRGLFKFVTMSLEDVTKIDYAAISVLTSLNDELKYKGIILRTILPKDEKCSNYMMESGYANNLFDENGKRYKKAEKSDLIFFEKGSKILSGEDNKRISELVRDVMEHLTGIKQYSLPLKTVILEICGNSIEWSGTDSQQWLLGVKYYPTYVVFTVTDVGKGILETLHRKFTRRVFESFKSEDEILKGAFFHKYGSTSQEVNRNKGLPAVKSNFDNGVLKNLIVLTNNVLLSFADPHLTTTFEKGKARFRGTLYQWEMDNDCLKKLQN